jgi:hypothetical protein
MVTITSPSIEKDIKDIKDIMSSSFGNVNGVGIQSLAANNMQILQEQFIKGVEQCATIIHYHNKKAFFRYQNLMKKYLDYKLKHIQTEKNRWLLEYIFYHCFPEMLVTIMNKFFYLYGYDDNQHCNQLFKAKKSWNDIMDMIMQQNYGYGGFYDPVASKYLLIEGLPGVVLFSGFYQRRSRTNKQISRNCKNAKWNFEDLYRKASIRSINIINDLIFKPASLLMQYQHHHNRNPTKRFTFSLKKFLKGTSIMSDDKPGISEGGGADSTNNKDHQSNISSSSSTRSNNNGSLPSTTSKSTLLPLATSLTTFPGRFGSNKISSDSDIDFSTDPFEGWNKNPKPRPRTAALATSTTSPA